MEKSRHKQFIGFTLCAVPRSKTKSWAILIQHMKDGKHPSVQGLLPASHFVAIWVIRPTVEVSQCLCSSHSYLTAPKGKRSDAGNLEVPMRSCKVLPLMKRWKLSRLQERKKIVRMHRLLRSTVGIDLLSVKLWRRQKKLALVLLAAPQSAKVMATVCVKHSADMEKALCLCNKIFWERGHIHITFIMVYCYNCSILLLAIVLSLLLCLTN